MADTRIAGITGIVFGLAAVPVLHFMAVDLEGKAGPSAYLAHADDRYLRIAYSGSGGLVLAAVLLVHLLAVRMVAVRAGRGGLLADASTAIAAAGPLGVFLSSCAAIMAAYGAHEGYTFESVRPMGILAENLFTTSLSLMAGSALLVAVLALRAGGLVAVAWVLVAGVGLLVAGEPVTAAAVQPAQA